MDLSTILLVSPHTSKEELQFLYLEVYKQQKLPGLPPGEPELMEEVCLPLMTAKGETKEGTRGSSPAPSNGMSGPPGATPPRGRGTHSWTTNRGTLQMDDLEGQNDQDP